MRQIWIPGDRRLDDGFISIDLALDLVGAEIADAKLLDGSLNCGEIAGLPEKAPVQRRSPPVAQSQLPIRIQCKGAGSDIGLRLEPESSIVVPWEEIKPARPLRLR